MDGWVERVFLSYGPSCDLGPHSLELGVVLELTLDLTAAVLQSLVEIQLSVQDEGDLKHKQFGIDN